MRLRILSLTAMVLAALIVTPTDADALSVDVSRTSYKATGLEGHPDLSAGGVIDVTLGRRLGAREVHHVSGAAPTTAYAIFAEIFFATACAEDDPFGPVLVPEGVLETNTRGSGQLSVTFPGAAFTGAPDTFWVRWSLSTASGVAYQTGCVLIELGE